MSKDPAFLFYPSDFLTGTMFFSNEELGIYIKLLCAQHQQNGSINKKIFDSMVSENSLIREKFKKDNEGYYNQRMLDEMVKRKKKSDNLSANALKRWSKEKQKQYKSNAIASDLDMPIEDEDINRNEVIIELWNDFAKKNNLSKITETRKKHIKNRLKEKDFDLGLIFDEIKLSDFLLGKKTDWKIDFDFIFKSKDNYIKILEGKYKGNENEQYTKEQLDKFTKIEASYFENEN